MKKTELKREMSWFDGVNRRFPSKVIDLAALYIFIVSGVIQDVIDKIRKGLLSKTQALAGVTPGGIFSSRCKNGNEFYSGILCLDLDDCPLHMKAKLAEDTFLPPSLIFESPSGTGLKVFICVDGAAKKDHSRLYEAAAHHIRGAHGLIADPACKDISRLCFVSADKNAYYNPDASVSADALLRLLPPAAAAAASSNQHISTSAHQHISTSVHQHINLETDEICILLNNHPSVLQHAFSSLRSAGWKRIRGTDYWDKPGGKPGRVSAIFNYYKAESRWVFTCFSTKASPFEAKGYSLLGIIAVLDFNSDFEACIAALSARYLDPGRTAFVKSI